MKTRLILSLQTAVLLVSSSLVLAQQPSAQEHVVALKTTLGTSAATLKNYEWIETTVISLKGEEKSRQMNKCYHAADGGVQKTPLTTTPPAEKKKGVRGKITENKTAEMTDYMKAAVALVKQYVPPQPALIQRAKDTGKLTVQPMGQRVRLIFADYIKPGDSFAIELDLASNRPVGAKVSTYLDKKEDAVALEVGFSTLNNNAVYVANVTLAAPSKNMNVAIENSGYRPQ